MSAEETESVKSYEVVSTGQQQLVELRSSGQVENGSSSSSPHYWDDDGYEDGGPKPSDLYGEYTWNISDFSRISERRIGSTRFEVGGCSWYIVIYPQGRDVCNHVSLFLCVANHDKLLPGWSQLALYTIAVVNEDPKKSKYFDSLHRFWKKENECGWKEFMKLSKMEDGFIDTGSLKIKAQVQVIRERADRPFRCLDYQYRRELLKVYCKDVEQIFHHLVGQRRAKFAKLLDDKARWSSFRAFWLGMDPCYKAGLSSDKTEPILELVLKHFIIKEKITSPLVMESLCSGLKSLEGQNKLKKNKGKNLDAEKFPVPIVRMQWGRFLLLGDMLVLIERAVIEPLPLKDEMGSKNHEEDGNSRGEYDKDSIEHCQRRLTESACWMIQIFILGYMFSNFEAMYNIDDSLKKQEELIREEEAALLAESERKGRHGTKDKEKKSKKSRRNRKK